MKRNPNPTPLHHTRDRIVGWLDTLGPGRRFTMDDIWKSLRIPTNIAGHHLRRLQRVGTVRMVEKFKPGVTLRAVWEKR